MSQICDRAKNNLNSASKESSSPPYLREQFFTFFVEKHNIYIEQKLLNLQYYNEMILFPIFKQIVNLCFVSN